MSAAGDFLKRRAVDVTRVGRYSLASRYDSYGHRREFACRTTRISPFQMLVSAPVTGPMGERVISYFGEFGQLDGFITDVVAGGFLLDLSVDKAQRQKLANKLDWIEARAKDPALVDARKDERFIPQDPHTTLLLADGTALSCFAIDVSPSGVAVSADIDVAVGARLAVGRTVGQVVRIFAEGFAVKFDQPIDPALVERAIKPTSELVDAATTARRLEICYI